MESFYRDKVVFVTGACGTVGRELVKQLLSRGVREVRALDHNETAVFFLMEEYQDEPRVKSFLGDIRDRERLKRITQGVDILFHTAAYKHVILSEYHPFDVVQTNILGTENVIEAALENQIERVIFTSSDKAVNPTNVMGASKLMCEKLITAANTLAYDRETVFASVRFGNVIGSRGSVVPVFQRQIAEGGPVTLTDRRMTRFIMTLEEAAGLVLRAAALACGGEVFITKMPVMRIEDLARVMIDILAPRHGRQPQEIEIIEIGAKPGEKLYEELMTQEETRRSWELRDMFVTLPAFQEVYQRRYSYPNVVRQRVERAYVSATEPPMSRQELKEYLLRHRIFERIREGR